MKIYWQLFKHARIYWAYLEYQIYVLQLVNNVLMFFYISSWLFGSLVTTTFHH